MGERMTPSQQAPLVERLNDESAHEGETVAMIMVRWNTERKEAAARITELEGDLKAAFREISKLAREAGEATGRLAMSEAAGIVDGWRERAERAEARCRALEGAWTWLAGRMNLVLDCDWPDEEDNGVWQVHRVSGSVNDREWELVGSGATPLEAVEAARLSLSGGGGREEKGSARADLSPASRSPEPSDLEDEIADALQDSLGPDWTCRDGAKAVVRLLEETRR